RGRRDGRDRAARARAGRDRDGGGLDRADAGGGLAARARAAALLLLGGLELERELLVHLFRELVLAGGVEGVAGERIASLAREREAEVTHGAELRRVELARARELADRVVDVAALEVYQPEVQTKRGVLGRALDQLTVDRLRFGITAEPEIGQPEEVHDSGVV